MRLEFCPVQFRKYTHWGKWKNRFCFFYWVKNKFQNFQGKLMVYIAQRKEFYRWRVPESSYVRKEAIDKDILITARNNNRKIIQSRRITSGPAARIRKWSQINQFRWTSIRVIPTEKTEGGYFSMMIQGFKRYTKWRTNSPTYPFSVACPTYPNCS